VRRGARPRWPAAEGAGPLPPPPRFDSPGGGSYPAFVIAAPLTPERWRRIRATFDAAAELGPDERARYLDLTCGADADLRAQVEVLLGAAAQAGGFLEQGAAAAWAAADESPTVPPRQRIGPYRLIRTVGEGGMGTVYLAERADGDFHQRVAIKVVRRGFDSDLVVRRFVHERQILASLEHPLIARFYDGGTTEDGQPFFVMEYIEGRTLLDYCADRGLDTRARLVLFLSVCAAVQYAHQRLVVHRDLKPGNVLVTAEGVPKLLDFGVAKVLEPRTGQTTELTMLGLRPLTPEYASPEQVRGQAVTTASDIYSLGVILYELLTGQRPYELRSRSAGEIERAVCEQAPARPSTRVPALRRTLAGDLDDVVLQALRKEPERRYVTVEQLAADLRKYLAGRPVSARADTIGYRARKFVTRHRAAVAASAIVMALLLGLIAYYTARLARERDLARHESLKARQMAAFLGGLFELTDLDRTKGVRLQVSDILDRGAKRIEAQLADSPNESASIMGMIGHVYAQMDLKAAARPLLERAYDTRRRLLGDADPLTAASERELGEVLAEVGEDDAAVRHLRHALAVEVRALGPADVEVARTLAALGDLHRGSGDYGRAAIEFRHAAAIAQRQRPTADADLARALNGEGQSLLSLGRPAEATPRFRRALAIRTGLLGEESPSTTATRLNLSAALRDTGELEAAIAAGERALAAAARSPGSQSDLYGYCLGELADSRGRQGEITLARDLYSRGIAVFTRLYGDEAPPTLFYRRRLAVLIAEHGEAPAALTEIERLVESARRRLGPEHPRLGQLLMDRGHALELLGRHAAAVESMRDGLAILRRALPADSPRVLAAQHDLDALSAQAIPGSGASAARTAGTERLLPSSRQAEPAASPGGSVKPPGKPSSRATSAGENRRTIGPRRR